MGTLSDLIEGYANGTAAPQHGVPMGYQFPQIPAVPVQAAPQGTLDQVLEQMRRTYYPDNDPSRTYDPQGFARKNADVLGFGPAASAEDLTRYNDYRGPT